MPLEAVPEAPAPEPPRSDVLEAVAALPGKYREAIYLFYYEGYSIGEIGVGVGVHQPLRFPRVQFSHGRSLLQRRLHLEYD